MSLTANISLSVVVKEFFISFSTTFFKLFSSFLRTDFLSLTVSRNASRRRERERENVRREAKKQEKEVWGCDLKVFFCALFGSFTL